MSENRGNEVPLPADEQDSAADTKSSVVTGQKTPRQKPAPLLFTRNSVSGRPISVNLKFSTGPLEGVELGFKFNIQLSDNALKRREKWLGATQAERTAQLDDQILDEVADLLAEAPTGFGDWPTGRNGATPGALLREYVAGTENEDDKFLLKQVLEAANNGYWAAVTPREFRPQVSDSRT